MNLGKIFIDGDWSSAAPDGPPRISFPMRGDSIYSSRDMVLLQNVDYVTVPNPQVWTPNQRVGMVEQDFVVQTDDYKALPLNTPYDPAWSLFWPGIMTNGSNSFALYNAILISEGDLQDLGSGCSKFTRRFATIPPSRSEIEQFCYQFPGYDTSGNLNLIGGRSAFIRNVASRIQYDYFVFDDIGILTTPLFPDGNRLQAQGIYPDGLILKAQNFYQASDGTNDPIAQNLFLAEPTSLTNDNGFGNKSTPSIFDWNAWAQGFGTSNGLPPELVAESSTLNRWLGNIFERRTRFVLVQ